MRNLDFNKLDFSKAGYKFEQWYGIVWLELALQKSQEVKATKLLTDLSEEEIKNLGIMTKVFFII